jgi:hypothetical protein
MPSCKVGFAGAHSFFIHAADWSRQFHLDGHVAVPSPYWRHLVLLRPNRLGTFAVVTPLVGGSSGWRYQKISLLSCLQKNRPSIAPAGSSSGSWLVEGMLTFAIFNPVERRKTFDRCIQEGVLWHIPKKDEDQ